MRLCTCPAGIRQVFGWYFDRKRRRCCGACDGLRCQDVLEGRANR